MIMAPSHTSYQSTSASGSHLNIIANNKEIYEDRDQEADNVQEPFLDMRCGIFPEGGKPGSYDQ